MQREANGRFALGNRGGPGRPRGFRGISEKIMQVTCDGDALIAFAWGVLIDPTAPSRDRWLAHQWLSDRGLGKVAPHHEVNNPDFDGDDDSRPLMNLSDHALDQIEAILRNDRDRPTFSAPLPDRERNDICGQDSEEDCEPFIDRLEE